MGAGTDVVDLKTFNRAMLLATRQAGTVARLMQSRVLNEGKADATSMPNDDDALRARRAAKTVVDEVVQEILLLAAEQVLDPGAVGLDAEEETPTVASFGPRDGLGPTLVLDPVDGTIEYLEAKDSYAVCVGLVDGGRLLSAQVHFPARGVIYALTEGGAPLVMQALERHVEAQPLEAVVEEPSSRVVYKNGRVEPAVVRRLEDAGFEVHDDTEGQIGAPDAILACLHGAAAAYVSHTRQMRDVLLGGIVGALPDGYASDWRGEPLAWPDGGRVSRAVFGAASSQRDAVIECLAETTPGEER